MPRLFCSFPGDADFFSFHPFLANNGSAKSKGGNLVLFRRHLFSIISFLSPTRKLQRWNRCWDCCEIKAFCYNSCTLSQEAVTAGRGNDHPQLCGNVLHCKSQFKSAGQRRICYKMQGRKREVVQKFYTLSGLERRNAARFRHTNASNVS